MSKQPMLDKHETLQKAAATALALLAMIVGVISAWAAGVR